MFNYIKILLLILTLTACSTQQGHFRYYQLTPVTYSPDTKLNDVTKLHAVSLVLNVPDYLKQNKMVMKLNNNELYFAELHLWTQLPVKAFKDQLINNVVQTNGKWYITNLANASSDHVLNIDVTQFYPTEEGDVILQGNWTLSINNMPQMRQNFFYQKKLIEDGFGHATAKQSELIAQLVADLNSDFQAIFSPSSGQSAE